MRRRPLTSNPAWRLVALTLAGAGLSGCVERVLHVRSQPPGAAVFINGKETGVTPVEHSFSFYGTVSVVLRKEGFVSHRVEKELDPPWYEYFPLDLISEFLVPWPLRDEHDLEVTLEPAPETVDAGARKTLKANAAAARRRAEEGRETEETEDGT